DMQISGPGLTQGRFILRLPAGCDASGKNPWEWVCVRLLAFGTAPGEPPISPTILVLGRRFRRAHLERRQVYYSGRVQGVGFRYTARQIAGRFAVTGFVENLGDGRVHLIVEGETREIDRFLAELSSAL